MEQLAIQNIPVPNLSVKTDGTRTGRLKRVEQEQRPLRLHRQTLSSKDLGLVFSISISHRDTRITENLLLCVPILIEVRLTWYRTVLAKN